MMVCQVPTLKETVAETPADDVILLQNSRTGEIVHDPIPRSLVFNAELHRLFKYSFLIHLDDSKSPEGYDRYIGLIAPKVPTDILEPIAWALEQFINVLTECTDAQLVAFGHIVRAEESTTRAQNGRHVAQSTLMNNGRFFMVCIRDFVKCALLRNLL